MSQKYVIYYKKALSAKSLFINKRIYLRNLLFINTFYHKNAIYKELQCIELQGIFDWQRLAPLCIAALRTQRHDPLLLDA